MTLSEIAGIAGGYCTTCHCSITRPSAHACHYCGRINVRECPDCTFGHLDCHELGDGSWEEGWQLIEVDCGPHPEGRADRGAPPR